VLLGEGLFLAGTSYVFPYFTPDLPMAFYGFAVNCWRSLGKPASFYKKLCLHVVKRCQNRRVVDIKLRIICGDQYCPDTK
jgi:hypothetical protein